MASQVEKALVFQELHRQSDAFVIPNPWDIGTARILEALGFKALATTSAGFAFTLGRNDGKSLLSREETLLHCKNLVQATHLPVSADLENGFGHSPEEAAKTITLAAEAGLVGGSIEDATGNPSAPLYDLNLARERITAAVEASKALSFPFTLTARAENFLFGRPDLDDTIKRLQAFEEAGADVLYAPGLRDLESIRILCSALSKPVNVVMGLGPGVKLSIAELSQAGVKRISLGSSLARAAIGAFLRAANEIKNEGSFDFAEEAISFRDLAPYLEKP